MGQLLLPKVFLVGYTTVDMDGVIDYLKFTKQEEFLTDWYDGINQGIAPAECLCSLFSKLCYKSLVPGKNANVSKTRDIGSNLQGTYDQSHGSVFEHVSINFIITQCSRVFTHELVRHRAGTAFSQTSGRYCRLDEIGLVFDPILDPVKDLFEKCLGKIEDTIYLAECKLGLRKPPADYPTAREDICLILRDEGKVESADLRRWVPDNSFNFDKRKKLTSALRRIAPNGQDNEIGFTANIRAIRHMVQMRTAGSAEWEIRYVFAQIYELLKAKYKYLFYRAKTRVVEGLPEIYGMRANPYEIDAGDPKALQFWGISDLQREIADRTSRA